MRRIVSSRCDSGPRYAAKSGSISDRVPFMQRTLRTIVSFPLALYSRAMPPMSKQHWQPVVRRAPRCCRAGRNQPRRPMRQRRSSIRFLKVYAPAGTHRPNSPLRNSRARHCPGSLARGCGASSPHVRSRPGDPLALHGGRHDRQQQLWRPRPARRQGGGQC